MRRIEIGDRELYARAAARAEFERRQLVSRIATYIPLANPEHVAPDALQKLYDVLDRIHRGEQIFCIIEGPPRTRKTTTVFHAVCRTLKENPKFKFGYGTYSSPVAREQSTRCREMADKAGIWTEEREDEKSRFATSKSMSYWATREGGGAKFFGRGGGVIGSGFDLLFCDDPIKDWDEYNSEASLESAWRWMLSLINRLEPGGSFILGHHRWGDDDPIGRLKAQIESGYPDLPEELRKELANSAKWEVVTLSGVEYREEPNGALVPDFNRPLMTEADGWFSRLELVRKYAASPEQFDAQIGQRPRKSGSVLFPEHWANWEAVRDEDGDEAGTVVGDIWMPFPSLEGKMLIFSGDTATSEAATADFTAIVLGAFWWQWSEYLQQFEVWEDVIWTWYERWSSPDVVENTARIVKTLPSSSFAFEKASAGAAQFQFLKRDHSELPIYAVTASTSKRERVVPYAAASHRHRIRMPVHAPWLPEWRRQTRKFTGRGGPVQDDIPDAAAHGYNYFAKMTAPPRKSVTGGERKLRSRGTGGF